MASNIQLKLKSEEDKKIENALKKIKYKIAVMSGKGGTGKTTVTVNIAQTLAEMGYKVGVLDADITGPNVPLMFGVEHEVLKAKDENTILPVQAGEVKIASIEFLLRDKSNAVIWRGPLKIKAIKQFIGDVYWDELDFLIVDLPPGSSDEPLSVVQTIKDLDGMIIVTTPQQVSLLDVSKSINFARVTNTPIIGIIENMSGFICPHCGETTYIFKKDGGKNIAEQLSINFLGKIPLNPNVCESGDIGMPAVKRDEKIKEIFNEIVNNILKFLKDKEENKENKE